MFKPFSANGNETFSNSNFIASTTRFVILFFEMSTACRKDENRHGDAFYGALACNFVSGRLSHGS